MRNWNLTRMEVDLTPLAGVVVIKPRVFEDARGYFLESYHAERYAQAGIDLPFVQDNQSVSVSKVLRGLHSQIEHPQGKLVRALSGCVWDVAADTNPDSPTYKQWFGIELSASNKLQLYVPPGYLHGFVVLSKEASVAYKCTALHAPGDELRVLWNDSELNIDWPVQDPQLSLQDRTCLSLREYVAKVYR